MLGRPWTHAAAVARKDDLDLCVKAAVGVSAVIEINMFDYNTNARACAHCVSVAYKLGVTVYRHLAALQTSSFEPLMLLLAIIVYELHVRSADMNRLTVPRCGLSTDGCRAFHYTGLTVWNSLPDKLRNSDCCDSFKWFLKTVLFSRY